MLLSSLLKNHAFPVPIVALALLPRPIIIRARCVKILIIIITSEYEDNWINMAFARERISSLETDTSINIQTASIIKKKHIVKIYLVSETFSVKCLSFRCPILKRRGVKNDWILIFNLPMIRGNSKSFCLSITVRLSYPTTAKCILIQCSFPWKKKKNHKKSLLCSQ